MVRQKEGTEAESLDTNVLHLLPSEMSNLFMTGNIEVSVPVRCFCEFMFDLFRGFVSMFVVTHESGENVKNEDFIWCINVAFNRFMERKIQKGWKQTFEHTYKDFPLELFIKDNPRTLKSVMTTHFNNLDWGDNFDLDPSEMVGRKFDYPEVEAIFVNMFPVHNVASIQSIFETVHFKFMKEFETLGITKGPYAIRYPNRAKFVQLETDKTSEKDITNAVFESIQRRKQIKKNRNRDDEWSTLAVAAYPQDYPNYQNQRRVSFDN